MTATLREIVARTLVPYYYGGFENQDREEPDQDGFRAWKNPPCTPNARAYELTDKILAAVHMHGHAPDQSLSVLVKQYALDLRRNASGGDDYPYEYAKATADYLEELIKRAKGNCTCAQAGFPDSCDNCDGLAPKPKETAQDALEQSRAYIEHDVETQAPGWRTAQAIIELIDAALSDSSTLRECDDGGPCYLPECSAHGCMHGSDSSPEGKDHV